MEKALNKHLLAMKRLLVILVFTLPIVANAQGLFAKLVDEGNDLLTRRNIGYVDVNAARQNFRLAKWFSFSKHLTNSAKHGLALCKLTEGDTVAGISKLKHLIGPAATKIDKAQFTKIHLTKREKWARYYAANKLIELYLAQSNYTMAAIYLTYVEKHVKVVWYCGLGLLEHNRFIAETHDKIAKATATN